MKKLIAMILLCVLFSCKENNAPQWDVEKAEREAKIREDNANKYFDNRTKEIKELEENYLKISEVGAEVDDNFKSFCKLKVVNVSKRTITSFIVGWLYGKQNEIVIKKRLKPKQQFFFKLPGCEMIPGTNAWSGSGREIVGVRFEDGQAIIIE